jgi:hypothetical protein
MANRLRAIRPVFSPAGENLWRLLLNVCVDDDDYVDNARPHFLQNRETGEYLELDRLYYRKHAGGEYQGNQHFVVTSLADEAKLKAIQARDAMKVEICKAKGIPLMICTEDDLSVDAILAKIPPELPRATVNRNDIYVQTLEELCEEYAAGCRRARAREQSKNVKE